MGKTRAEIQKAYRERQKAKGPQFLEKERLRSRGNYIPADVLSKRKLSARNHKNKLRNRLSRARKAQRALAAETVFESSGYGSHLQSSENEQLNSPLSSPGPPEPSPQVALPHLSPQPGPSQPPEPPLIVKLPIKSNNKANNLKKIRRRALGKAQRMVYQLKREVTELKRKIKTKSKQIERLAKKKEIKKPQVSTPRKKTDNFVESLSLTPRRKQLVKRKVLLSNILLSEIEDAKQSVSLRKRKILHRLVMGRITKKYRCVKALSRETGFSRTSLLKTKTKSYKLSPEHRKCLTQSVADSVITFLRREDNSRMQPGKNDTKKVDGEKMQTRVLTDYLKNLHCKFSAEHPEIKLSLASFCRLRPRDILLASFISRNACLCIKHQNMAHMVQALRKHGVKISDNPENLLIHVDDLDEVLGELPSVVTFKTWKRVQLENGIQKMKLVEQDQPVIDFRARMKQQLDDFSLHVHTLRHQYQQLKHLKDALPAHDMIVQMDFAENFSCRSLDEVQTAYWNQTSVTLHPTVVYFKRDDVLLHQSFVFISNTVSHSASTVCSFIDLLVPELKKIDQRVEVLHYWTDSPSSQYRNRYIFNCVANHSQQYGVGAKWNYFEAGHGKGPCDGLGGTTKRLADEAVRQGNAVIQDATEFFKWAEASNMKGVRFVFVSKETVKEKHELMMSSSVIKPVKNTMKLHAVGPCRDSSLLMVNVRSCYCQSCLKGDYCDNWTKVKLQCGGLRRTTVERPTTGGPVTHVYKDQLDVDEAAEVSVAIDHDAEHESNNSQQATDQYKIGAFVATVYDGAWYVGRIEDDDPDDGEFEINFLERAKCLFRWPCRADRLWMTKEQIMCEVQTPEATGKSGRLLKLAREDLLNIENLYTKALADK